MKPLESFSFVESINALTLVFSTTKTAKTMHGSLEATIEKCPEMKTAPRLMNPPWFPVSTFPSTCQGFASQVIASDFARLQAETQAAEEAAKAEYEEFMEDSKVPRGCQGDAKGMPRGPAVLGLVPVSRLEELFC